MAATLFLGVLVPQIRTFGDEHAQDPKAVPAGLIQLGTGSYYSPYAIVVDKKARTLTLWKQSDKTLEKVVEFPSDIGKQAGNKSKLNDHRTPEGIYFTLKMIEGPGLNFDLYGKRAYTLDYPNLFDQREGKTGSGIWLHAIPENQTLARGSRGCVVVRNESILALGKYISPERTPVLIYESVPYQSAEEKLVKDKEIETWLAKWIDAWKKKDIESYIGFYSPTFHSMKMNREKWKIYKDALNKKYEKIDINLYSPIIFEHNNGYVVRGLQAYHSDGLEDFGEKTIYIQKETDGLKIIGEQWDAVDNPGVARGLARCCLAESAASKN